jgi:hypothetical protein
LIGEEGTNHQSRCLGDMLGITGADPAIFAAVIMDLEHWLAIYPNGFEANVCPHVAKPEATAIVNYEAELRR